MSRAEWPERLAVLVAPDRTADAADALAKILAMLDQFPERCFASRSALEAVANAKRRTIIPTLPDVRAALTAWLAQHPEAMYSGYRPADWNIGDHKWYDYWEMREAEQFKPVNDVKDQRGNLLDLIRTQAPRVHAYLTARPE